ncbi:hypothetical protein PRIPAC_90177 [Pristionchus pacificus]|uniref:HTH CENPB-type domain-containing protein n=1 Tax=Pristionchus pacificus TaxID=54126 RepID=A0A2A6B645_PRIPA|nr:hypothetical protein PRIPAC_90177 [Pristionchus pacificus]|eukprot:PDM61323.1 hypothetical protein PRIPAC_50765 [Pristionchus pacificus]
MSQFGFFNTPQPQPQPAARPVYDAFPASHSSFEVAPRRYEDPYARAPSPRRDDRGSFYGAPVSAGRAPSPRRDDRASFFGAPASSARAHSPPRYFAPASSARAPSPPRVSFFGSAVSAPRAPSPPPRRAFFEPMVARAPSPPPRGAYYESPAGAVVYAPPGPMDARAAYLPVHDPPMPAAAAFFQPINGPMMVRAPAPAAYETRDAFPREASWRRASPPREERREFFGSTDTWRSAPRSSPPRDGFNSEAFGRGRDYSPERRKSFRDDRSPVRRDRSRFDDKSKKDHKERRSHDDRDRKRDRERSEDRKRDDRLKILLTEKEQGLIESEEEDEEALVQESGDSDSDYDAEEDEKPEQRSRKPWTKELCDKMLEFYRSKDLEDGRRGASQSFKRMQNRFRAHMKTEYDLTLLRKYEKTGVIPSERYSAMRQLASDVRAKLGEKMKKGVPIHDTDIRKIALDLNKLNAASGNFKASATWVSKWKVHHRIVSRKVTKFVTRKATKDREKVLKQIDELRIKFLAVVRKNPGIVIINADQTGQVKEMHSTRTLAEEGSKDVVVEIESKSATTHSVTVLPTIYLDGRQHPIVYVHLGEPTGSLPAKKAVYGNKNLVIGASKSHIMNREAAARYFKEVLFVQPMPKHMLLLLDSWSLFLNHSFIQGLVPKGHKVTILNIPKGGTSLAQPLDLCYNQQWKCVMRRLNDAILVHDIDFVLHTRDNLLRCISQVYWAFGAPMFKEYRKYGWYRGGFLTTHPAPFVTPPKKDKLEKDRKSRDRDSREKERSKENGEKKRRVDDKKEDKVEETDKPEDKNESKPEDTGDETENNDEEIKEIEVIEEDEFGDEFVDEEKEESNGAEKETKESKKEEPKKSDYKESEGTKKSDNKKIHRPFERPYGNFNKSKNFPTSSTKYHSGDDSWYQQYKAKVMMTKTATYGLSGPPSAPLHPPVVPMVAPLPAAYVDPFAAAREVLARMPPRDTAAAYPQAAPPRLEYPLEYARASSAYGAPPAHIDRHEADPHRVHEWTREERDAYDRRRADELRSISPPTRRDVYDRREEYPRRDDRRDEYDRRDDRRDEYERRERREEGHHHVEYFTERYRSEQRPDERAARYADHGADRRPLADERPRYREHSPAYEHSAAAQPRDESRHPPARPRPVPSPTMTERLADRLGMTGGGAEKRPPVPPPVEEIDASKLVEPLEDDGWDAVARLLNPEKVVVEKKAKKPLIASMPPPPPPAAIPPPLPHRPIPRDPPPVSGFFSQPVPSVRPKIAFADSKPFYKKEEHPPHSTRPSFFPAPTDGRVVAGGVAPPRAEADAYGRATSYEELASSNGAATYRSGPAPGWESGRRH